MAIAKESGGRIAGGSRGAWGWRMRAGQRATSLVVCAQPLMLSAGAVHAAAGYAVS